MLEFTGRMDFGHQRCWFTSMESSPVQEDFLRKCVSCAEKIDKDAKICKYCKSPQSALRHLSVGATTLALMTALISVTTAAIPVIRSATTPDDSNIRLVFQGIDPDDRSILLLAYNSGTKPGGLGRSILKYKSLDPNIKISLQQEITTVDKAGDSSLVQEGHGRQLRLKLANSLNHAKILNVEPEKLRCQFEFQTAEFVGSPKTLVVDRACDDVFGDAVGLDPSAPLGGLKPSAHFWSIEPDEELEDSQVSPGLNEDSADDPAERLASPAQ